MNSTEDSKSIYREQIHQLKQLQSIDDEIHEEQERLEEAPKDLKALENQFRAVSEQRALALDKISHLTEQETRLRREIEEDGIRLEKSRNKMMEVGDERELNAVNREISALEGRTQPKEEERITILEELATQRDRLNDIDKQFDALNEQLEESRKSIDITIQEANARLAELNEKRMACGDSIPKPIFRRYEFIRARLEHPVIVPLRNNICSSCNIAIPPQTFNDLLRGEQILNCPNCQRLIVWDKDYYADDPEAAAALEKITQIGDTSSDGGVTTFFEDACPGGKRGYNETPMS